MRAVRFSIALLILVGASPATAQPNFLNFESGQVRPLTLSPDGTTLFAVNTPDNHLEIFDVSAAGISHRTSVAVGLEPVTVAARNDAEVWVVNHLSDSVSVVDVSSTPPRVVRTLLVGDEPRDCVFAGTGGNRAFITTAHMGQHRNDPSIASVPGAGDPQLTTPGIDRADVWVFDATAPGSAFGGEPIEIVTFFTDTPRALAVSNDGNTVYVAGFHTGNRTTTVSEGVVCNGFASAGPCSGDGITSPGGLSGGQLPGGNPGPSTDHLGVLAPEVGLIVQYDPATGVWKDELGRNWNNGVRFNLPDEDVFALDANTLNQIAVHVGVGTTLFNMVVHQQTGDLLVTNTEARNVTRFEGPGSFAGSTVQGHLAESHVTIIDNPNVTDPTGANVKPRHLNSHLDYSVLAGDPGFDPTARLHSLAIPTAAEIDSSGNLYVAAFGSSTIGVIDITALENGTFDPTVASADYLPVSGGGPSGLALDPNHDRLYVLTRFDNSISVFDLTSRAEIDHQPIHNPEPAVVRDGRPFLYDAKHTSANGEASCAGCHIYGDLDQLAWDLGNPDDEVTSNPMSIKLEAAALFFGSSLNGGAEVDEFHPMKGPMTTQTLKGLANGGPMHWRGDRSNGVFGIGTGEELSFDNFIVAFSGLLGRATILPAAEMNKFTDFALTMILPPNPVRALDNSLTPDQQAGLDFYAGSRRSDGFPVLANLGFTCEGCHTLDPSQGFFGTNGDASFENEEQIIKIAHLRNLYKKIGMHGMPAVDFFNGGNNGHKGDQIRGFGFLHDGSVDTIFRFFQATVFNDNNGVGFDGPAGGDVKRRQMEQFMLAFDSDLAPIVGQQVTLDPTNSAVAGPRIDLLMQRANTSFVSKEVGGTVTECDLVVKGTIAGEARGAFYDGTNFVMDRAADPPMTDAALRALATTPGQELTYTCAPPGLGQRMALDRDQDGVLDGDDNCAAVSNPGQSDGNGNGIGDACDTAGAVCGDGFVNGTEACDDGTNDGGEGECLPGCGGFQSCGDGSAEGTEVCDDGTNDGGEGQCLPGCLAVQLCGDATVEGTEACDDGTNDGGEGQCLPFCLGVQSCGDGSAEGTEICDDGVNDGGPGECLPGCGGFQSCGDGDVEGTEVCDDGTNDGGEGECLPGCGGFQSCGDGDVEGTEVCDDGVNDGGEAECLSGCGGLQSCGDATTEGTEVCDDGVNDGGESECVPGCGAIQTCGDASTDGTETCDDGVNDGGEGECVPGCGAIQTCGDGIANGSEACDGADDAACPGSCNASCTCGACPTQPTSCLDAGKHSLLIRNSVLDVRDSLKWKWTKGSPFDHSDTGLLDVSHPLTVCVYDSIGGVDFLATALEIAPGTKWTSQAPKGFKYKDPARLSGGVLRAQLRAGPIGKTKAFLVASGGNLLLPAPAGATFFEQSPRVTVQLRNDETGTCWGSEFTTNTKNRPDLFKAKTP